MCSRCRRTHLAETRSVHDHLVDFAHPPQELIDTRPLENMKVVPVVFDLDGDDEVRLLYRLRPT